MKVDKKSITSVSNTDGLNIQSLAQTEDTTLWIGAEEGLFFYRKDSIDSIGYTKLINNSITGIAISENDNLWISSSKRGIFKVEKKDLDNYKITSFEYLDLYDKIISNISLSNEGLWLGTNRGIINVKIRDDNLAYMISYDHKDGIVYNNSNFSNMLAWEGKIYAGTESGLLVLNTQKETISDNPPRINITSIELLSNWTKWDAITNDISPNTNIPISAELKSNQNHLTINFEAITHNNISKIRYTWKLEGLDNIWSNKNNNKTVIYRDLPPGQYRFMVKACNRVNDCSQKAAIFSFNIKYPFYKSRFFYTSIVLGIISILILYIRRHLIRTYRLRNRIQKLKKEYFLNLKNEKQKNSSIIKKLKKSEEKIYSSLEYSQKIQKNIILRQSEKNLKDIFPNSFAFLRPRSIVSSVFYWIWENKETTYIALADSLSTGIPGAFISIIGYEKIKETVIDNINKKPSFILQQLHSKMKAILSSHNEQHPITDGMAAIICKIDKKKENIVLSSAGISVITIEGDNLMCKKGGLFGIGTNISETKISFEDLTIKIQNNTMIYLFNKAFYNQFDERGLRKYGLNNFQNLIKDISKEEFHIQPTTLSRKLDLWKGNSKQTEDILLLGFKYSNH